MTGHSYTDPLTLRGTKHDALRGVRAVASRLTRAITAALLVILTLGVSPASAGVHPPPYPNHTDNWTILDAQAQANYLLSLDLDYSTDESRGVDCSSFVSRVGLRPAFHLRT